MAEVMYPVVQDILESIQQIEEYLDEVSENEFYQNTETVKLCRETFPFSSTNETAVLKAWDSC